jgi:predicted nucleotidyltransferase
MPDALETTAAREAEAMFHAEGDQPVWAPALGDVVAILDRQGTDHLFIGGLASMVHGRPRVTHDIDVMVRPPAARPLLQELAALGYDTDERAPHWLFKAHGRDAEIDIIFQAVGEMYLDDAMLERSTWAEPMGIRLRIAGAEDTLLMKALAHREISPRHWFDALAIIANGSLDWDVLAELAITRPRRVLSLLIYAQSEDLFVPTWLIDRLYHASRGDEG